MEQVLHNSLWASQICSEPTPWREAAGLDVTATTVNFGNTQHDARHVDGYWKARRHAFHRRYHSLESRFDDNCSPIGDRLRAWSLSAGRARARPRGAHSNCCWLYVERFNTLATLQGPVHIYTRETMVVLLDPHTK